MQTEVTHTKDYRGDVTRTTYLVDPRITTVTHNGTQFDVIEHIDVNRVTLDVVVIGYQAVLTGTYQITRPNTERYSTKKPPAGRVAPFSEWPLAEDFTGNPTRAKRINDVRYGAEALAAGKGEKATTAAAKKKLDSLAREAKWGPMALKIIGTVEAWRFKEVLPKVDAPAEGMHVVAYGHQAYRKGVITHVTPTKVEILYSTPSSYGVVRRAVVKHDEIRAWGQRDGGTPQILIPVEAAPTPALDEVVAGMVETYEAGKAADAAQTGTATEAAPTGAAPAPAATAGATMTRTRVSIGTQIQEAGDQLGILVEAGPGSVGLSYLIGGRAMSPGEAADYLLDGGFKGAFGRAVTLVNPDRLAERDQAATTTTTAATGTEAAEVHACPRCFAPGGAACPGGTHPSRVALAVSAARCGLQSVTDDPTEHAVAALLHEGDRVEAIATALRQVRRPASLVMADARRIALDLHGLSRVEVSSVWDEVALRLAETRYQFGPHRIVRMVDHPHLVVAEIDRMMADQAWRAPWERGAEAEKARVLAQGVALDTAYLPQPYPDRLTAVDDLAVLAGSALPGSRYVVEPAGY